MQRHNKQGLRVRINGYIVRHTVFNTVGPGIINTAIDSNRFAVQVMYVKDNIFLA